MNTIITPTIGRKVWFWPNGVHIGMPGDAQPQQFNASQALDATVICVHGDRMVNLHVIDHGGASHSIRSVTLKQAGDDTPPTHYCEWMPYQTKQAAADNALSSLMGAVAEMADAADGPAEEDDGTKVTLDGILDLIVGETYRACLMAAPPSAN